MKTLTKHYGPGWCYVVVGQYDWGYRPMRVYTGRKAKEAAERYAKRRTWKEGYPDYKAQPVRLSETR